MKPEIAIDLDVGTVDLLGADGLRKLMQHYAVWLLTGKGEHRFQELQATLSKLGIFPGTHYVGITDRLWSTFRIILSPRATNDPEHLFVFD